MGREARQSGAATSLPSRVGLCVLLALGACSRGGEGASPASRSLEPSGSSGEIDTIDLELVDAELFDALRAIAMNARVAIFADPDLTGRVSISVRTAPWDGVLAKVASDHDLRVETLSVRGFDRAALWISKDTSPSAPQKEFVGVAIEVSFRETPIRSAAQTIADLGNTTIVVEDDVHVDVTLRLRRIPWDLALYHLAQKYELRIVRAGDVLRIARRSGAAGQP